MADPGEGTFDNPAFGQGDEAMRFVAFDDFDLPGTDVGNGAGCLWSLVAGIGKDALDEGEQTSRAPIEDQPRAVAILHIGGMNHDVQEKAERVDENVPLAAGNLLARIKALRVERGAPF